MKPEEKFKRAVRYLSVDGDQTLEGQINQPAIKQNPKKLPGQRVMFWVALVAVVVGLAIGIWALSR
jgi:hypothetical protein